MKVDLKEICLSIFQAGLKAVDPREAVKRALHLSGDELQMGQRRYRLSDFKRIWTVGAGKAAVPMAQAIEDILGERLKGGVVITKYGHIAELKKVRIMEAGHPIPDEAGQRGARALVDMVKELGEGDLLLCLLSGGGSALLPFPVEGVSLTEKQETTKLLLNCGAEIHEINAIRKHLSRIKGGGLARFAYPATVVSLILSDVIGDDLDVIASGPTAGDKSTFAECIKVIEKYHLTPRVPSAVWDYLRKGAAGEVQETPKPDDPIFRKVFNLIVGSNIQCLEAAALKAQQLGYHTLVLSSFIGGETREVAKVHGAILKEILRSGRPLSTPACLISGGETTVTIRGKGKGGRNQEFVLACGMEIAGWEGAAVFSAGTDGTDGPTDAAGAFADWRTVERALKIGLDPEAYLQANDSYHFFKKLGDLVITGPTNTNVMDIRILIAR
ncbi:MAG: glycerate kinase [Deltaproteobacteria bacterium]|nr:MAG: glycerate kinase [Deltaproteobacteria bacterium]